MDFALTKYIIAQSYTGPHPRALGRGRITAQNTGAHGAKSLTQCSKWGMAVIIKAVVGRHPEESFEDDVCASSVTQSSSLDSPFQNNLK